jgi:hypothetical protein
MFAEYEYIYLIFIILLFVFLRARKQIRGRKANIRSIFTRPLLYIVLTLLLLAATPNADVLVSALLFSVLGYLLGTKLGVRSKVFEKDGIILSKGSNEVFFIWTGAFILRLIIEIAFPLSTVQMSASLLYNHANLGTAYLLYLVVDSLLAFSAGILLGEARHIYRMYKSIRKR